MDENGAFSRVHPSQGVVDGGSAGGREVRQAGPEVGEEVRKGAAAGQEEFVFRRGFLVVDAYGFMAGV